MIFLFLFINFIVLSNSLSVYINNTLYSTITSPHFPRGVTLFEENGLVAVSDVNIIHCCLLNLDIHNKIVLMKRIYSYECFLEDFIISCHRNGCLGLIVDREIANPISSGTEMVPGFFFYSYDYNEKQLKVPVVEITSNGLSSLITLYLRYDQNISISIKHGDYNEWTSTFNNWLFILAFHVILPLFALICTYLACKRLYSWYSWFSQPLKHRRIGTGLRIKLACMTIDALISLWRIFYYIYDPCFSRFRFSYQAAHMLILIDLPFYFCTNVMIAFYFAEILNSSPLSGKENLKMLHGSYSRLLFGISTVIFFAVQLYGDFNRASILPSTLSLNNFSLAVVFISSYVLITQILVASWFIINGVRILIFLNQNFSTILQLSDYEKTKVDELLPVLTLRIVYNSFSMIATIIVLIIVFSFSNLLYSPINFSVLWFLFYFFLQCNSFIHIIAFSSESFKIHPSSSYQEENEVKNNVIEQSEKTQKGERFEIIEESISLPVISTSN